MQQVSAPTAWHWTEDAFPPASFCVLVLVRDGMRVPPFDQHPDGDGALRNLGLDHDQWLEWLRAVLSAQARLGRPLAELAKTRQREIVTVLRRPADLCPGDDNLRNALHEMWVRHQADFDVWKRSVTGNPVAARRRGSPSDARHQWESLSALRDRLPALSVLLVRYLVPTVMPMLPATLLVAPAEDATEYTDQLVAGALVLASEEADPSR